MSWNTMNFSCLLLQFAPYIFDCLPKMSKVSNVPVIFEVLIKKKCIRSFLIINFVKLYILSQRFPRRVWKKIEVKFFQYYRLPNIRLFYLERKRKRMLYHFRIRYSTFVINLFLTRWICVIPVEYYITDWCLKPGAITFLKIW